MGMVVFSQKNYILIKINFNEAWNLFKIHAFIFFKKNYNNIMRILGIDPGYERVGIALLEKTKLEKKELLLYSECFKTSPKIEINQRIFLIAEKIEDVIKKWKPTYLAIETLFLNTNQKTAMRVAEARGVVIYKCLSFGIEIIELSPLQIKMATTGYGKADKNQMIKMIKMLIKIDENKKSDDELDAIAIAFSAFSYIKKQ